MIRARLFSTFAFLALTGVFTPFVAPLVDHHSAERMPYHGHLQPLSVPHEHDHAVSHDHEEGTNAAASVTVMPDRDGQPVQPAGHGGTDLLVQFRTHLDGAPATNGLPLDEPLSSPDPFERPPEVPPRA